MATVRGYIKKRVRRVMIDHHVLFKITKRFENYKQEISFIVTIIFV